MAESADTLTLHHYECSNESYTLELGGGIELTLMLLPTGEFMMGAGDDYSNAEVSEFPKHRVKIAKFLMGVTPVTQAQWSVVSGYDMVDIRLEAEPSSFKGDDLPVENVSWHDATEFCKRLSKKTGKKFHLPSESLWEYACRAETLMDYHFGPKITPELANFGDAIGKTTVVKLYLPNRWGLYDMHGNVWEWCQDHWHDDYEGAPTDGSAWLSENENASRILRGGSWGDNPWDCRSAFRSYFNPDDRFSTLGFRVSCASPRAFQ